MQQDYQSEQNNTVVLLVENIFDAPVGVSAFME